MTGTRWVAPGRGATFEQLVDAVCQAFELKWGSRICKHLTARNGGTPTNLELTGNPLTPFDLHRIYEAETDEGYRP